MLVLVLFEQTVLNLLLIFFTSLSRIGCLRVAGNSIYVDEIGTVIISSILIASVKYEVYLYLRSLVLAASKY